MVIALGHNLPRDSHDDFMIVESAALFWENPDFCNYNVTGNTKLITYFKQIIIGEQISCKKKLSQSQGNKF